MTETCIFGSGDNATISTNSTSRFELFGSTSGWETSTTSEANISSTFRGAGTLTAFYLNVGTNGRSTNTTFTVRVNGADTALAITVAGGATGVHSVTGSVAVSDGDVVVMRRTTSTGGGSISALPSYAYVVSGQSFAALSAMNTAFNITTTGTSYGQFSRLLNLDTTEAVMAQCTGLDGVTSHLRVFLSANTWTVDTTARLRVGAANVNQIVTVTAATAGEFIDTSNTDTITDTSSISLAVGRASGSGTLTYTATGLKLTPSTANQSSCLNGNIANQAPAAGTTLYGPLWGAGARTGATARTNSQTAMPVAGVADNLTIKVSANSANAANTVILEINGSAGNQTITIPASTTGTFQDTTHTDTFAAGDLLNYATTHTGASGTAVVRSMGMRFTAGADTNVALTGVSATGALGSLGKTLDIALAGLALTAALGTITPVFNIPLTGLGLTGSLGTVTPIITIDVALTGVSATTALGSLGKTFDIALSGVEATLGLGTVSPPAAAASITRVRTGSVAIGAFVRPETNSFTRPENRARSRVQIRTLR